MDWTTVDDALRAVGLRARGGFEVGAEEALPRLPDGRAPRTLVLAGSVGASLWPAFSGAPELADGAAHPLDRWSRRVLSGVAAALGCGLAFPFGGPPHHPFSAWAERAEPVARSPLGLLIHPEYGLWHAYRGALLFAERIALPVRRPAASPCAGCRTRPCLTACPVGAFDGRGYDVAACTRHLDGAGGPLCYAKACLARAACPVGRDYAYDAPQAVFHMTAFRVGRAEAKEETCRRE